MPEVPTPSTTSPQHQLSEVVQARLAALQAAGGPILKPDGTDQSEQLTEAAAKARSVVKGADGDEVDVATGEYKPAEQPKADTQSDTPAALDTVAPLEGVRPEWQADADAYRADMAGIARDMGMPSSEASAIFDFIGTRAMQELASDDTALLTSGQTPGPDLSNPYESQTRILRKYGDSLGHTVLDTARKNFEQLPGDVQAYLTHDSGDGRLMVNHPGIIEALALRGYFKLSPSAAAKELSQIRQSAAYQSGEKLTITKAQILAGIVARGQQDIRPPAETKAYGTSGEDVPAPVGHQTAELMRAEMRKLSLDLVDTRGELASNLKKRKASLARRAELMAQLGGAA